jgi:hypothetical protein
MRARPLAIPVPVELAIHLQPIERYGYHRDELFRGALGAVPRRTVYRGRALRTCA